MGVVGQGQIDQMHGGGVDHVAGRQHPFGGGSEETARGVGVVAGQGGDGILNVLPEGRGVQHIFMRHGLEQRFQQGVAEAEAEERGGAFGVQFDKRVGAAPSDIRDRKAS